MPKKIKDACVKLSSYTDRNGETKNRYENVGSVLQMDDGGKMMLLKRTFNPAGVPNPDDRDTVIISFFDVKERESGGFQEAPRAPAPAATPAPATANGGGFDDDIPFNSIV